MNQPSVISVNPGKKTIGAIKEEGRRYDILSGRLAATIARKSQLKEVINFIFGIDTKNGYTKSGTLAFSRLATGIAFCIISVLHFSTLPLPITITSLAVGVSVSLGLLQRIVGLAASAVFAVFTYEGIFSSPLGDDVSNVVGFSIAACLLLFALIGPGIFSIDQLIRRAILRIHHRHLKKLAIRRASKSNDSPQPLTYKSYFEIN